MYNAPNNLIKPMRHSFEVVTTVRRSSQALNCQPLPKDAIDQLNSGRLVRFVRLQVVS